MCKLQQVKLMEVHNMLIDENILKCPISLRSFKIAGDQLALSYYRAFNVPHDTETFNTYGPRQSLRAFIPTITTQILERKNK